MSLARAWIARRSPYGRRSGEVRTTNQRQLWVLIGVVIVTMVGGMIKVVFFP
jgi:hypothetical protein